MPKLHILEFFDCKTHKKRIYEYTDSAIALIKAHQHVFWDDVDDQKLEQIPPTRFQRTDLNKDKVNDKNNLNSTYSSTNTNANVNATNNNNNNYYEVFTS